MHRAHHNVQRTVKLLEPRQTSSNAWHRNVTCVLCTHSAVYCDRTYAPHVVGSIFDFDWVVHLEKM